MLLQHPREAGAPAQARRDRSRSHHFVRKSRQRGRERWRKQRRFVPPSALPAVTETPTRSLGRGGTLVLRQATRSRLRRQKRGGRAALRTDPRPPRRRPEHAPASRSRSRGGSCPQSRASLPNSPLSPVKPCSFLGRTGKPPLAIAGFSASKATHRQELSVRPKRLPAAFRPCRPSRPQWGRPSPRSGVVQTASGHAALRLRALTTPLPRNLPQLPATAPLRGFKPTPHRPCRPLLFYTRPSALPPGGLSVPVSLACWRTPSRHAHPLTPIPEVWLSLSAQSRRLSPPRVYETFAHRPRSSVQSHFSQGASSETPDATLILPSVNCPNKNLSMHSTVLFD